MLGDENTSVLSEMLREKAGYKVTIRHPERGNLRQLCAMVRENAKEYALQYNAEADKDSDTLIRLAQLLGLEVVPEKIEAFDISNYGDENITAGKVRLENCKFLKSAYRTYKINSTEGQDDYLSMKEAVSRRLAHTEDEYPDLILLDGGRAHVAVIRRLLEEKNLHLPVFGMVKDSYHKTRALTDDENEISIAREQSVFQLIFRLQEEVHRYTVSRMTTAKRKTLKHSSLEDISGIGPKKAKALLTSLGGLSAVKGADKERLMSVSGISERNAVDIIRYFSGEKDGNGRDGKSDG